MNSIRKATGLFSVLIFFSVSGFVPEDNSSSLLQESQLSGHGIFIQNIGQFSGGEFLLRGAAADYWISAGELRISQPLVKVNQNGEQVAQRESFLLGFVGSNPTAVVEPFDRQDTVLSYLIGSDPAGWYTRVPVWSGLRIRNLYNGIDLIIYGALDGGGLDWVLDAKPGADVSVVQLKSSGVPFMVTPANDLQLMGILGTLRLNMPVEADVPGSGDDFLAITGDARINSGENSSASLSSTGGTLQAVRLINYMSFLGGSGQDRAYSIAAENNNAYITGYTDSIDFPLTAGVVDTTLEGTDAFVAKVDYSVNALEYATFLGGELSDVANDIAVENGIAYLAGATSSTSFPGMEPWENRDKEAFAVSLTTDGTGIRYARRFGGTTDVEPDEAYGIAVEAGNAYITGLTYSKDLNGVGTIAKGDIFTIKLNSSGVTQYLKIYGGGSLDTAYDIAVSGGVAYITGESDSKFFMGPFPAGYEAFVLKIDAVGGQEWTTVLSGSETDRGNGIVLDGTGNIYVTGATDSANFLSTLPAHLPYGGLDDGFIVRMTSVGTPNFRTFLGGTDQDRTFTLAVDSLGGVQVIGETYSADFPLTTDALDSTFLGSSEAFVARILPNETDILDFSSYIGGSDADYGRGLALDIRGSTYICGETTSSDFPLTSPFDATFAGIREGFVGKLTIGPVPGVVLQKYTNDADADLPPGPYIHVNDPVTWRYDIFNTGSASLDTVILSDSQLGTISCPSTTLAPGASMTCTVSSTAVAGQYENLGTVVAQPPGDLEPVTDEDYSHYFGANPLITITATTEGLDGRVILVGETADISYLVKNTGNVPLGSVSVTDTAGITVSCPQTILTPNEEMTCDSSILVTAGTTSHTADVSANPPSGLETIYASDITSHFGAEPSIVLTHEVSVNGGTSWQDSDTPPGPALLIGNAPKFRLSVYNSGNVALTNIALPGCSSIASLDIGATSTACILTGTWAIGEQQNEKTATGSFTDGLGNVLPLSSSNSAYYFGANPTLSIQKEISLDGGTTWLDTSSGDAPTLLSGTDPQYRITVQNTGNVSLLTTISDPALDFGTSCQPVTLEASGGLDTKVCTAVKSWASGLQSNTAHATASFSDAGGHTANLDVSDVAKYFGAAPAITFEKYVSVDGGTTWLEADIATGPTLLSGHAAPQYKVTITNSGNVLLSGIDVADDVLTLSGCSTVFDLAVSASKGCTATAAWTAGSHENTASLVALYTDSTGNTYPINLSDKAHYFGAQPEIAVSNQVSVDGGSVWLDADSAAGPELLQGYNPIYKNTVQNTGNVALDITLSNNLLTLPPECDPGTLAGAGSHECTVSGTWGLGQQSNFSTAAAIFTDSAGNISSLSVDNYAYYFGAQPLLNLEKYVSGDDGLTWDDADSQPGPYFLDTVALKYKLVLDNTGNVPISNLNWSDPAFNLTGCTLPAALTPEASPVECILAGTWAADQVDNLASASGSYTDSGGHSAAPSDTDEAHYFGAQPGVSIVKSTNGEDANSPPGPYIPVGDTVNWTYTITNTGNVPLTGIGVSDDNGTPLVTSDDFTASCGSTSLAVSDQETCTASGTALEGQYTNNGTVVTQPQFGEVPVGLPLSASDLSHYFGARISMTLQKTTNGRADDNSPPGPFIVVGDTVSWNYMVTNTSNIAIGPVEVWDDNGTLANPADDLKVCTISSLSPGQSNNPNSCKWSATAVAGQYANTGTAKLAMFGKNYTASDKGHYYGYIEGEVLYLTVSLNDQAPLPAPGIYFLEGEEITFRYTIFNSSPSTVTNLSLEDTTDTVAIDCPTTELAPSASTLCSRTISALPGEHIHDAQATGEISSIVHTGSTSSSYIGVQSGIALDVHTNGQDPAIPLDLPVKNGSAVNWQYIVTNTSNVMLTDVTVTDDQGVLIDCPATSLEIGAEMTCTASGIAVAGAYSNTASASGSPPGDLAPFSAEATSYYYGVVPGVLLDFRVNNLLADEPPGPEIGIGEVANLTYIVTNTGNYPLIEILVVDDAGNSISCPYTLLDEGQWMTCTASETVAEGEQTRIATVTGMVNFEEISDTDPVYYTGIQVEFYVYLPLIMR